MARKRKDWHDLISGFNINHLVFLDESGCNTDMTRRYAYSIGGSRAVDSAPLSKPKNTTILSSIQRDGTLRYATFSGGTTVEKFKEYLEHDLLPYLNGDSVLVMDNMKSHQAKAVKALLDKATAIRGACKNLAEQGVLTIDYQSGVHTSLEAAVRRNIMGGLGLMQEQITRQNHDDFGCDGWEISAHAASAPDHEPIQGKQYSDAEYEALNNSLVRRIGTLNCGHAAFPIILGVNSPQYIPEELEKFRADNEKGITYQGRHYTSYQATQMQRKIERTMRTQKRRILVDEAAGDKDKLLTDQIKLRRLSEEYKRFSKAAGLRTENERLHVSGFGRKQAASASAAVEKYSKVRYHEDGTVVVTDDWTQREHPHVPQRYAPNAIVDTLSQNGRQRDRTFFDEKGRQIRQVSNGPHGNRKRHPYGESGEHAHDILWKDGKIIGRPPRELTDEERKESVDILESK